MRNSHAPCKRRGSGPVDQQQATTAIEHSTSHPVETSHYSPKSTRSTPEIASTKRPRAVHSPAGARRAGEQTLAATGGESEEEGLGIVGELEWWWWWWTPRSSSGASLRVKHTNACAWRGVAWMLRLRLRRLGSGRLRARLRSSYCGDETDGRTGVVVPSRVGAPRPLGAMASGLIS